MMTTITFPGQEDVEDNQNICVRLIIVFRCRRVGHNVNWDNCGPNRVLKIPRKRKLYYLPGADTVEVNNRKEIIFKIYKFVLS